jgi:arylsulfatase A-like enzyme
MPLSRLPLASGVLLGALAGAAVGLVDGARAAWLYGAPLPAALAAMLLAAAVDALAGAVAGAAVELALRVARWGRQVTAPWPARAAAFALAGLGAAAAAAAMVAATAHRNNRFLAAGLAAGAAVAAALPGALEAPALARLLARGRSVARLPARLGPGALLALPAAVAALAAAIFFSLWHTRILVGPRLVQHQVRVALLAFALPWVMARLGSARLPPRRGPWAVASAGALALYAAAAIAALALSWSDNLRFAPWTDIGVGAAIAAAGAALARLVGPRLPSARGRVALAAGGAVFAAVALLLAVGASEAARKPAVARAGLVGTVLDGARQLFDFDHDGYASILGGGDCDDHDPTVHPGALDLPGDGVDSDCDGQDAVPLGPPAAALAPLPDAVPPDLNLLLVTIDTLRADHLGCYGYGRPTSPEIDRLAAEGTLFENGWAHAPSTRYSMPALATGRWPSAIEWDESIWWPRIGRDMRTIGEALHDDGYFTGGLFSYSYFARSDRRGFERGMDVYSTDRAVLHVAVNGPMESRGSSSREMADDAIAFIEAHRDRKFFLWVHFYDPHLSYEPHPEVPSFGNARVDLYDGEIRFTDLHFGRLLARLRALGLWDRTAVVVTGDHGEGFGEHGVTEHGFDLYPAQTKVPFIVRVPGLPAQKLATPAGHVDVAATLVNLARGKPEPSFLGHSLVPLLTGAAHPDPDRWVFQEVSSERGKKRALVTAARHLIWNWVPGDTTECYDRARDPDETHDVWSGLSTGADARCADLKRELTRLVAALALPPGVAEKLARDVSPPGAPPVPAPHPLAARLGDTIEVRGYDVAPAQVAPGGDVDVTIYFAAARRPPPGWRLFFHAEGPGGMMVNLDHVPVDGVMPLERWRPGQQIRDHHHLVVAPSWPRGTYTLYVGAFHGRDRLPVEPAALSDGKDRLRVGTFVVR